MARRENCLSPLAATTSVKTLQVSAGSFHFRREFPGIEWPGPSREAIFPLFAPDLTGRKRHIYKDVTENSETNLVAAARSGDAESFSRLCEQHYPALVAIAYAQLADRGLAEDAAQEALLVAYRDITRLKDAGRFLPWLAAICRNTAIDMAKSRARERQVGIEDGGPVWVTSRNENDVVAVTREIIFRLRPDLRDIILLRYYNEMSYSQIAALLGISEEAVNGKLRRARTMIREQLQRRESMETEP